MSFHNPACTTSSSYLRTTCNIHPRVLQANASQGNPHCLPPAGRIAFLSLRSTNHVLVALSRYRCRSSEEPGNIPIFLLQWRIFRIPLLRLILIPSRLGSLPRIYLAIACQSPLCLSLSLGRLFKLQNIFCIVNLNLNIRLHLLTGFLC